MGLHRFTPMATTYRPFRAFLLLAALVNQVGLDFLGDLASDFCFTASGGQNNFTRWVKNLNAGFRRIDRRDSVKHHQIAILPV